MTISPLLHFFLIDSVRVTENGKCKAITHKVISVDASTAVQKMVDGEGEIVFEGDESDVIITGMQLDQGKIYGDS